MTPSYVNIYSHMWVMLTQPPKNVGTSCNLKNGGLMRASCFSELGLWWPWLPWWNSGVFTFGWGLYVGEFEVPGWQTIYYWLVVWIMNFIFHILGIIIPTNFHIFQRGWNHQPDYDFLCTAHSVVDAEAVIWSDMKVNVDLRSGHWTGLSVGKGLRDVGSW